MNNCISRQDAKLKGLYGKKGDTADDFNDKCVDCLDDVQSEEAIPVSWIELRIERFKAEDNAFCGLTANIMHVMLNEWRKEQEGETT